MADVLTRAGKASSLTRGELDDNWEWGVPELNTSTTDTLAQADNRTAMIFTGAANGTWSLPDASGLSPDTGDWTVLIKNGTTAYNLTLDLTDATDSLEGTVDGTLILLPGESTRIVWDGDNTGAGGFYAAPNPRKTMDLTANGVLAPHKNLKIVPGTTANDQITVTASELILNDGSGNFLKVSSVSVSDADIGTDASGGSTSGRASGFTRPTSGWAGVWVVSNGSSTYVLFDTLGNSEPDRTGFSGYYYGFVGAVYCGSGQNLRRQVQTDNIISFYTSVNPVINAQSSAGVSTTSLADFVPSGAKKATGYAYVAAGSAGTSGNAYIYSYYDGTSYHGVTAVFGRNAATAAEGSPISIALHDSTPNIYWTTGVDSLLLEISGWEY